MDTQNKLEALVAAARYDVCGYCPGSRVVSSKPSSPYRFIYRAALPGGGTVSLFKVLLTNVCVNDCAYCVNQVGRDIPRTSFRPEELARQFIEFQSRGLVTGLFLSSGIAGNPSRTMTSMIDTVAILRQKYGFKGYIHLKILPGAAVDCVAEACKLADRVSVNIEAPSAHRLAKLSSKKDIFHGIMEPMKWVKQIKESNRMLVPSGQTTQFVVGASGETDKEILDTTEALYREVGLRRAYYSAFFPVRGSRLEGLGPTPPLREHRLYQADWLYRVYRFSPQEVSLALGKAGNLALHKDPKAVIAENQPWLFPVDINAATCDELLRVPGIGPVSARRIVETRKEHTIFAMEQLKKMRVVVKRAAPYIWFPGMTLPEKQLSLLSGRESQLLEYQI